MQTNAATIKKIIHDLKIAPADNLLPGQNKNLAYYYMPHCLMEIMLAHTTTRERALGMLRLPDGSDDLFDFDVERAAKTHYEKELAKLKLKEMEDNLFTMQEIAKLSEEICLPLKQFLLSLPSMMTNRLGADNLDVVQQFEKDIHEKLIPLLDNGIAGSLQGTQVPDLGTDAAPAKTVD